VNVAGVACCAKELPRSEILKEDGAKPRAGVVSMTARLVRISEPTLNQP
jgi:hypothetical protein